MGTRGPQSLAHRAAGAAQEVAVCAVCGATFNPERYQVVVDGGGAYDRVACADAAVSELRWRTDELARRRRLQAFARERRP